MPLVPPSYDSDDLNPIVQESPYDRCRCFITPGRKCDSRKHSYESAAYYSWKKNIVYRAVLEDAAKRGLVASFSTASIRYRVPGKVLGTVLSRFRRRMRPISACHYEAVVTRHHTVHFHMLLLSKKPIPSKTFREAWRNALGEHRKVRASSTQIEVIRNPIGAAAYLAGNTQKKRRRPLFSRYCGFRISGVTEKFFLGRSWSKTLKRLPRARRSSRAIHLSARLDAPPQRGWSGQPASTHIRSPLLKYGAKRRPRLPTGAFLIWFQTSPSGVGQVIPQANAAHPRSRRPTARTTRSKAPSPSVRGGSSR